MFTLILWCALSAPPTGSGAIPYVERIFFNNQEKAFRQLLPVENHVETEMRPLLHDFGSLTADQVFLVFRKLQNRYVINDAKIVNSQSDTNYAWLEIHLQVELIDKRVDRVYQAVMAFHFKITAAQMALSRWILQDVR